MRQQAGGSSSGALGYGLTVAALQFDAAQVVPDGFHFVRIKTSVIEYMLEDFEQDVARTVRLGVGMFVQKCSQTPDLFVGQDSVFGYLVNEVERIRIRLHRFR